jgi:hypothetical protein
MLYAYADVCCVLQLRGEGVVSVWVHCRKVSDGSRFPAEMIDVYWTASFDIPADLRYARCKCMRP